MPELEIIGGAASNFVWVCRIACAEKGVPYKLTSVMPHTPEVDAIHPFGKIPAMRHGDLMLGKSRAICSYVDRTFDGPQLVPADPDQGRAGRAMGVDYQHAHRSDLDPPIRGRRLYLPGTPDKSPNRTVIEAALPKMQQQFPVMDKAVKSGYLVGNSFTLADMDFMPILYYMTKFPESSELVAGHPNLKAYFERHVMRKSVQDSIPESAPRNRGPEERSRSMSRERSTPDAADRMAALEIRCAARSSRCWQKGRARSATSPASCRSRARRCRSICVCSAMSDW